MIKKLFLTAILLCFCFVGFSQNTPEQMAKKITSKMAKVLSLDEVQKEEVYVKVTSHHSEEDNAARHKAR